MSSDVAGRGAVSIVLRSIDSLSASLLFLHCRFPLCHHVTVLVVNTLCTVSGRLHACVLPSCQRCLGELTGGHTLGLQHETQQVFIKRLVPQFDFFHQDRHGSQCCSHHIGVLLPRWPYRL